MDESTTKLVVRCRDRDAAAEKEIFNRYFERICRLAEKHIAAKYQSRIDAEEIPNTVFRTFFRNARKGAFEIHDANDFRRLIFDFTCKKVADAVRYHDAQMRDPAREVRISDDEIVGIALREPEAEVAAILAENTELIQRDCDPFERQVFQLRMKGFRIREISQQLDRSLSAVNRALQRIRRKAERRLS